MDSVLEIDSISHHFLGAAGQELPVIADASFSIEEGEFCALVGPSGCGKSTLLHICAGLVAPKSGEVRYQGRPLKGVNVEAGYVTQDSNLLPWLTVERNIALGLEIRGTSRAESAIAVDTWIERVGLAGFGAYYPSQLSGGMQKRCAIARSFAYEPGMWLMDEPFGALDALTRVILQNELRKLWEGGVKSVLFVTHDLTEAIALADKIVIMSDRPGRIVDIIDVGIPHPRDIFNIADNREFAGLRHRLWEYFAPRGIPLTDGVGSDA